MRLLIYVSFLLLFSLPASAHPPYFQPISKWVSHEGETYRLEGWYGDGLFGPNPARIVLRHQNSAFSAISPIGTSASGFCPSIHYCWGFIFTHFGFLPDIWRVDPDTIIKNPEPVKDTGSYAYGEPDTIFEKRYKEIGFTPSYNILVWLLALIMQATSHPILFLTTTFLWFGFIISIPGKTSPRKMLPEFLRVVIAILCGFPLLFLFFLSFTHALIYNFAIAGVLAFGLTKMIEIASARIKRSDFSSR